MTTPYKVEFRVRCTARVTGVTTWLEWTQGADNWGTAVETTGVDWSTTDENLEESKDLTAINTYYTWEIDPSLLDFTKTLYVRLRDDSENMASTMNSTFGSQNNATQAYRPQLIITFANPGGTPLRSLMGVGT